MKNIPKSLFTLANKDQDDAIYLIPTAGTTAISLIPLSRSLDASRKIFSFSYQGMEPGSKPHKTLQEIATANIDELLETQPNDSYSLVGFCFGGEVAYEMTRQLEAKGKTVNKLVLIDTFMPLLKGETRSKEITKEETSIGKKILLEAYQRFSALPPENVKRIIKVMQTHLKASYRYRAEVIAANITLLQSPVYPDFWFRDWQKYSTGSFQKIDIAEDPLQILTGKKTSILAATIDEALSN